MDKDEKNLVKKVCQEYGITQTELSKMLDIPKGTISRWVSTSKMPKTAELALNLMLKNKELENKLNSFKLFKEALNRL